MLSTRTFVAPVVVLLAAVACSGGGSDVTASVAGTTETAAPTTEEPAETAAPTTEATEEPAAPTTEATTETAAPAPEEPAEDLPGTMFSAGVVLPVPGVSPLVGQGVASFGCGDQAGMVTATVDGAVPVVDGESCLWCMNLTRLEPSSVMSVTPFLSQSDSAPTPVAPSVVEGTMEISGISVAGPIDLDAPAFLVAGSEGATLAKVDDGFMIVSGSASLVIDVAQLPAVSTCVASPG